MGCELESILKRWPVSTDDGFVHTYFVGRIVVFVINDRKRIKY